MFVNFKLYDLKNKLYNCDDCSCQLYGKKEALKHYQTKHPNNQMPQNLQHSLDWMVILPGLDHLRMNGVKSIVSMLWEVFFQKISIRLGYNSQRALQLSLDCGDLHKADQMLACFMQAGSELLAKMYMTSTDDQNKTSSKMLTFLENHRNPNVKLLYESVFVYSLGYFILKAGIRKNDHNYAWCGKDLLARLFFTQNHPLYRKLILYMDIDRILMPKFMQTQIDGLVGVKVIGKGCRTDDVGENFDFVVEYINKKIKSNLIWAPSQCAWLLACRTYSVLVGLTNSVNKWIGFER